MHRTPALYELEGHQHRGLAIGMARHDKCAPFACNAPLALSIETNPLGIATPFFVVERCQGCGKIVTAWRVLYDESR